jgi:sigma-B regulation protein RsbQ
MDIIERNNIHVTGNLDAPSCIVFNAGFGLDQTSFKEIIPAFENDHQIVTFDNVSVGKSDSNAFSPKRYETINGFAADLAEIITALELDNIIYVGHSVSGITGMLTYTHYPELFQKMVLVGASPRYLNDPSTSYIGGFDVPTLNSLFEAMEANYYAWAAGFSKLAMRNEDRPELAEEFAYNLGKIREDMAIIIARAIFYLDHRAELPKLKIPTLILQTENDVAVPAAVGEYMHRNIPDSRLVKVHTEGHFPQISAPHEVIAAIQSFI